MLKQFRAWWMLSRFEHAVMVFVTILVAEAVASKFLAVPFDLLSPSTFFPALGPVLITAAAFILNDYFDFESDKANKRKERPLVSGLVDKNSALQASFFLYLVGVFLAVLVSFAAFAIAAVYALLSIAYNYILKKKPLVGNVFIASSMAISFIYGNLVVSDTIVNFVWLFAGMSFLAGIGREFLITLRDVKGDKKVGALTVPMVIGGKQTVGLASFLFLAAIILSWIPVLVTLNPIYFALILVNNFLIAYVIYSVLQNRSIHVLKKARNLSLLALVIGILAFAGLAI